MRWPVPTPCEAAWRGASQAFGRVRMWQCPSRLREAARAP